MKLLIDLLSLIKHADKIKYITMFSEIEYLLFINHEIYHILCKWFLNSIINHCLFILFRQNIYALSVILNISIFSLYSLLYAILWKLEYLTTKINLILTFSYISINLISLALLLNNELLKL